MTRSPTSPTPLLPSITPAFPHRPWQICHIITSLALGGAQKATLSQLEVIAGGHGRAHLLYGPGEQLDTLAQQMVHVQCWPIPALIRPIRPTMDGLALAQLISTLRRIQHQEPFAPILIHTHSSKAGMLGRLAGKIVGAHTIIHSIHGFGHQPHQPWLQRQGLALAERWIGKITDGFTADAQANLDRARDEGILQHQPATVLRCGIDCTSFGQMDQEQAKFELGLPPHSQLVLGIGCLKPQKNPLAFLHIATMLAQRHPHVVIWLAGDGELHQACKDWLAQHHHPPAVRLLGWRQDIPKLLAASSLLLHTARHEGLPQAFLQAMSSGVPIVATDVDGAQEAIEEGRTGYLVPYGDWTTMVERASWLLDHPKQAAAMGQAGREKMQPFTSAVMQQTLLDFYKQLQQSKTRISTA